MLEMPELIVNDTKAPLLLVESQCLARGPCSSIDNNLTS